MNLPADRGDLQVPEWTRAGPGLFPTRLGAAIQRPGWIEPAGESVRKAVWLEVEGLYRLWFGMATRQRGFSRGIVGIWAVCRRLLHSAVS